MPDPEATRAHLGEILRSESFRGSERCKQFLTFVVEWLLQGRQNEIKERVIGTEVFGRPADYEPVGDSIVRVNANEVRRRLARYYEHNPGTPFVIDLPAGSYVPLIRTTVAAVDAAEVTTEALPIPEPPQAHDPPAPQPSPGYAGRSRWWWAVAGLGLLLAAVAVSRKVAVPQTALDMFWEPVLTSREQPVVRLPEPPMYVFSKDVKQALDHAAPGAAPILVGPDDYRRVSGFHATVPTFTAGWDIGFFLSQKGRTPRLSVGFDLPARDLRQRPIVAISSRPSEWAMTSASSMRFNFRAVDDPVEGKYVIEDRKDPKRTWGINAVFPFGNQTADYALVSRLFDSSTGNVAITASGLTSFGSQAAAAFITNPDGWDAVVRELPPEWSRKNLQIVLHTTLVGRTVSPAKVIAVASW